MALANTAFRASSVQTLPSRSIGAGLHSVLAPGRDDLTDSCPQCFFSGLGCWVLTFSGYNDSPAHQHCQQRLCSSWKPHPCCPSVGRAPTVQSHRNSRCSRWAPEGPVLCVPRRLELVRSGPAPSALLSPCLHVVNPPAGAQGPRLPQTSRLSGGRGIEC